MLTVYFFLFLAFLVTIWTSYWLGVWNTEAKQRIDLGRCDHGVEIGPRMDCPTCETEAVSVFLAEVWRSERTVQ